MEKKQDLYQLWLLFSSKVKVRKHLSDPKILFVDPNPLIRVRLFGPDGLFALRISSFSSYSH